MIPESNFAEFRLAPCPLFRFGVATLHGLAALVILAGPFVGWVLWLLPVLLLSALYNWCRDSAPVLLCHDGERWLLAAEQGAEPVAVEWLPATRVGPRLTLLHGRSASGRHFRAVTSASLDADSFRRLRVLLQRRHSNP